MLKLEARDLKHADLFTGPMKMIMQEDEAGSRLDATLKVLENFRDVGRVVICKNGFRLVGIAIWTPATARQWLVNHRAELEEKGGMSLDTCSTLVNLFLSNRHRGQGIGSKIEAAMHDDMRALGFTHHLNFAYGTENIRNWLPKRPNTVELDMIGTSGDPIILASL